MMGRLAAFECLDDVHAAAAARARRACWFAKIGNPIGRELWRRREMQAIFV
jgi:hypothetical protein